MDNDLFEVYFEIGNEGIVLSDAGTTLMRLSYTFDYETEKRRELLNQIIFSHGGELKGDIIWKKINTSDFEKEVQDFIQILVKVSNMNIYSRETIRDLFFEEVETFVYTKLIKYKPEKDFYPLGKAAPYKVDYKFNTLEKPLFMFAVNNSDKARLATITCLQLITNKMPFQSLVVFKNFEEISHPDQKRLLNAADKVFTVFENDEEEIVSYFSRQYEEK